MSDFLLEIGVEELPASFLKPAAEALEQLLRRWFGEQRIACGPSDLFYTPRRLAVRFAGVAEQQESVTVEIQGPPKRAAFDAEGHPTQTALGFARAHQQDVATLFTKKTARGEYVFLHKTLPSLPTGQLLAPALPALIAQIPFPKNMRWGEKGFRFARPIRWIVALLGTETLHFAIEDVVSGNITFGHRQVSREEIVLGSPAEYEAVLRQGRVLVDPKERRQAVLDTTRAVLAGSGGEVVPDEELLEETTGIVELPWAVRCRFSSEHLSLPEIVVVTALKRHQRCFAVRSDGAEGGSESDAVLLPLFVAVTDNPDCDVDAVRMWYEKAAESRLRDARFFVEEDRRIGLEGFLVQEEKVVWLEGLGTLRDKTERLIELGRLLYPATGAQPELLQRAALLSKADLLSNMVREKEYTSLQGIIGGEYARLSGEPEEVARAIAEHYLPRNPGDPLPSTEEGRVLSIADKLDNICAGFVTGAAPTGSEDPFALRRQATGLLSIVFASSWREFPLRQAIEHNLALLKASDTQLPLRIAEFFRERMHLLLVNQGISYDIANAVIAVAWENPATVISRVCALREFRAQEGFDSLVLGQKRVSNILRGLTVSGEVLPGLFRETAEQELYRAAQNLEVELSAVLQQGADTGAFRRALELLLGMRQVIDRFFDDVLVMCEEPHIAANRQNLLALVKAQFLRVADLSQIVTESTASNKGDS